MTARTSGVAAQLTAPGVDLKVVDYIWNAGEQIHELERDYILRYRPSPGKVSVAARLPKGDLTDFGQLMFFPANVEVNTASAQTSELTRNIMCRFEATWFEKVWKNASEWDNGILARCFDMRNRRIEEAIQRLGAEAANPGFASALLVESLATVIAIEISRYFGDMEETQRIRTRAGQLSRSDLNRIFEYIDSFSNRCPSIEDIADLCEISPAHLRRAFKATTGTTVHQHVESVRLRKAQSLLAGTDLPLKEISFRLGFADSSTFSTTFKRASGKTPSDFRYHARH